MSLSTVLLTALILSLVPSILYALAVWWLDRYEKEPLHLLAVAFLWGAIPAIILAGLAELAASLPLSGLLSRDASKLAEASVVAPLAEECLKAVLLVALFVIYKREFDDVLDGIVYGAMVGLGFAMVENVFYLAGAAYKQEIGVGPADLGSMLALWLVRAGLFGLNHSMFTALTGAGLGYARSAAPRWQRVAVPSLGLAAAMLLHSLHNTMTSLFVTLERSKQTALAINSCLVMFASDWGGVVVVVVLARLALAREERVIRETLWEEVGAGRITQDEYAVLQSSRRRWAARTQAFSSAGFKRWRQVGRFFYLATELAFRKRLALDGDSKQKELCARDIARLHEQIDALKGGMAAVR